MSFLRGQGRLFRALAVSLAPVGMLALVIGSGACGDDEETDGATTTATDAGADVYVVQDGGGQPATPPEGEAACPAGECNYQSNEGCAATESCLPVLNGAVVEATCLPAGAGQSGSACAGLDCAAGHMCIEMQCRKLCCGGDWSACPSAEEHCITVLSYSDGAGNAVDTGAMVCKPVDGCDPLAPDTCATNGETCQIIDPTGAATCLPDGTGAAGEPCPCQGGYLCANLGDTSVCRRLCKAVEGGGEPFCDPGEACVHYADKHPPNVGECVPFE